MLIWMVAFLAMGATVAFAADIDGKWVAEVQGPGGGGTMQLTYTFKADGETLTGSMSTPMGEIEISDGKVTGNEVSFAIVFEGRGQQMRMDYKGTVEGDELKLASDTPMGAQEFTAKRAE
jgi:hypothetical protein